jgi:hypothetical protein
VQVYDAAQGEASAMSEVQALRVRLLNDEMRRDGPASGGSNRWVLTKGVMDLGAPLVSQAIGQVQAFERFDADDDPYGEHDFGAMELETVRLFWKIDYYDLTQTVGSPDPADPTVTVRVLTLMLAEEY